MKLVLGQFRMFDRSTLNNPIQNRDEEKSTNAYNFYP